MTQEQIDLLQELRKGMEEMSRRLADLQESQRKLSYILDPANSMDDIKKMMGAPK